MEDLPGGDPCLQLLGPDLSSQSPSYFSCILKGKVTAAFYEEADLVDGLGDMRGTVSFGVTT